ncbi:DUF6160 family protein [Acinetobacter gerneri]|uniref:DUF6160 family protein n=1 Tax=Acinetobacter gerneri TaxID=202952 RepID=UPI003A89FE17
MKKINHKSPFLLSTLMASMLVYMPTAHALQEMNDNDMRSIDGQDGVTAKVDYSKVEIDKVSWIDQTGSSSKAGEEAVYANLNNIKMTQGSGSKPLGTTVDFDVYSNDTTHKPGVHLAVTSTIGKVTADNVAICQTASCSNNEKSMGALTVEAYDPITFNFLTTNGLFSQADKAYLDFGVRDINLGLSQTDQNGTVNTLGMSHFNFNFSGLGYITIDPANGLTLSTGADGFADFTRDANTGRPGINLEFNVNNHGIIQAGANGRLVNAKVQLGGTTSSVNLLGTTGPTGAATNSIAGSTGMRFALAGEFTNKSDTNLSADQQASFDLGGAGTFAYGLRFKNITSLQTRSGITGTETQDIALNKNHGSLTMDEVNNGVAGGVYFNLVNSPTILLPVNTALSNTFLGKTNGTPIVLPSDYTQVIAATAIPSVVVAVRGMNFNAVSKEGQFTNTPDVTSPNRVVDSTSQSWGLGLPIYNLNANIALYGKTSEGNTANPAKGDNIVTKNGTASTMMAPTIAAVSGSQRLGFSAGISTQGVSADGSKTTSIMLIDGADNNNYSDKSIHTPKDYYIGLRNINMLLNGSGSIGFEGGNINVSMPSIKMVIAAQLAAGYLPGARYGTCPANNGCYAPSNNFATNFDVLTGIKARLMGGINFALIPRAVLSSDAGLVDGVNALNVVGQMDLDSTLPMNNSLQLIDPDGSTLGLDNLSGSIAFDNSLIVNKNNAGFNYSFLFNPQRNAAGVFRARDINLYPGTGTLDATGNPVIGSAQRLGELAITGGRLSSQMAITPRNGDFTF